MQLTNKKNTMVITTIYGQTLYYHSSAIANSASLQNGKTLITLNTHGFNTASTKRHINAWLKSLGLNGVVFAKSGKWYIDLVGDKKLQFINDTVDFEV